MVQHETNSEKIYKEKERLTKNAKIARSEYGGFLIVRYDEQTVLAQDIEKSCSPDSWRRLMWDVLFNEFYFILLCKAHAEAAANRWKFWRNKPYQDLLQKYESFLNQKNGNYGELINDYSVTLQRLINDFEVQSGNEDFRVFYNYINEYPSSKGSKQDALPNYPILSRFYGRYHDQANARIKKATDLFQMQYNLMQNVSDFLDGKNPSRHEASESSRNQGARADASNSPGNKADSMITVIAKLYGYEFQGKVDPDALLRRIKTTTGSLGGGFLWLSPPLEYRTMEYLVRAFQGDQKGIDMVEVYCRIEQLRKLKKFSKNPQNMKRLEDMFADIRLENYQAKISDFFKESDAETKFSQSLKQQEEKLSQKRNELQTSQRESRNNSHGKVNQADFSNKRAEQQCVTASNLRASNDVRSVPKNNSQNNNTASQPATQFSPSSKQQETGLLRPVQTCNEMNKQTQELESKPKNNSQNNNTAEQQGLPHTDVASSFFSSTSGLYGRPKVCRSGILNSQVGDEFSENQRQSSTSKTVEMNTSTSHLNPGEVMPSLSAAAHDVSEGMSAVCAAASESMCAASESVSAVTKSAWSYFASGYAALSLGDEALGNSKHGAKR